MGNMATVPSMEFVNLPHPRGGLPVMYLLQRETRSILELQTVQPRRHGAWFLDNRVSGDAFCYLATKVDPRFLLLPFLEAKEKYMPMDQIVSFVEGCTKLPLEWIGDWNMTSICDVNDSFGDDMLLFRLNHSKTLDWLAAKVGAAATVLAGKRVDDDASRNRMKVDGFQSAGTGFAAAAATTADGAAGAGAGADAPGVNGVIRADTNVALQIVSDYISPALAGKLAERFGVSTAEVLASKAAPPKRKTDWEEELELEKDTLRGRSAADLKRPTPGPGSGPAKKAAPSKGSASRKAPLKGMQSMKSFFGGPKN